MNHYHHNDNPAAAFFILGLFALIYIGIPLWWRWGDLIIAVLFGKKEYLHEDDLCKESREKSWKEWRERQRSWRRDHGNWNTHDIWKE